MKRLLALVLLATPAYAADMPLKARPNLVASYAAGGCGMYFGFNTMGVAGAVANGVPGASIVQGDIGGTLGYGCPIGTTPGNFWFAEGDFDFANLNGASAGLSMTGPAHFQQKLALGSPLSSVLGLLPNNPFGGLSVPALPACPANVICGTQYPFVFASLHEQDTSAQNGFTQGRAWLISPGVGMGLESRWSNGVVVDVSAQWKLDSTALSLGPQTVKYGNAGIVELTFKY